MELIPWIETIENEDGVEEEESNRISGLLSVSASWKCSADEQMLKKPPAHATLSVVSLHPIILPFKADSHRDLNHSVFTDRQARLARLAHTPFRSLSRAA